MRNGIRVMSINGRGVMVGRERSMIFGLRLNDALVTLTILLGVIYLMLLVKFKMLVLLSNGAWKMPTNTQLKWAHEKQ